jgi:hypothetical protein
MAVDANGMWNESVLGIKRFHINVKTSKMRADGFGGRRDNPSGSVGCKANDHVLEGCRLQGRNESNCSSNRKLI